MIRDHTLKVFFATVFAAACLLSANAQEGLPPISADMCAPVLSHLWQTASDACINKPVGYACNGGAAPGVEPAATLGDTFTRIGALVETSQIDALDLAPIQTENVSIGLVWLRLSPEANASLLAIGDVTLYDVTPAGFAPWTNILTLTSTTAPTCPAAPGSSVVVQTPVGTQANLVFNGVSTALAGTMAVRTTETATQFSMISGQASVMALTGRQQIVAGQMTSVPFGAAGFSQPGSAPTSPALIESTLVQGLPVALFDRPLLLPQPGYLATGGTVNLRTHPDVFAAVLQELAASEVLTLLGVNPAGDWYHVQMDSGQTGWVYAPLLVKNVGAISAVYDATPLPPQRLGELGTRGRVRSADGANLRAGPDTSFRAIARLGSGTLVDLVARSPYGNGWLKVNAGGAVGWMSPFTLDTIAFIEALPIEWNEPPFPTPTPVPGMFGNAFPNPDDDG